MQRQRLKPMPKAEPIKSTRLALIFQSFFLSSSVKLKQVANKLKMLRQVFVVFCFIIASTLAISPQVRAPPRPTSFSGSRPLVPLSHPLPSTSSINNNNNNNNRYSQSSFATSSTNRVNSYAPRPASPVRFVAPAISSPVRAGSSSSSYSPSSPVRVASLAKNVNEITILRSSFVDNQDGSYSYSFENSDGTKSEQRGYLKPSRAANEDPILVVEGSYSYYGPDGELYTVNYVADENGYRPTGAHIPTPSPAQQSQVPVGASSSSSSSQTQGFRTSSFTRPITPVRRF